MKKFLVKLLLLLMIITILLILLGYFLDEQFSKDFTSKQVWQLSKKENVYDYAFIGSSRVLNLVDVCFIDSVKQTEGINLGIGGADFRTAYLILFSFLEINNNTIETSFIQVDPYMFYRDSTYSNPDYDHFFTGYSDYQEISESFKHINYPWIYYYMPIIKYIEFNKVYNLTHFIRGLLGKDNFEPTKGSVLLDSNNQFDPEEEFKNAVKDTMEKEDLHYFYQILELMKEKDIESILYTAPIYRFNEDIVSSYPYFSEEIEQICKERDVTYFNFGGYFNFMDEYFKDIEHLNSVGARMFTKALLDTVDMHSPETFEKSNKNQLMDSIPN